MAYLRRGEIINNRQFVQIEMEQLNVLLSTLSLISKCPSIGQAHRMAKEVLKGSMYIECETPLVAGECQNTGCNQNQRKL